MSQWTALPFTPPTVSGPPPTREVDRPVDLLVEERVRAMWRGDARVAADAELPSRASSVVGIERANNASAPASADASTTLPARGREAHARSPASRRRRRETRMNAIVPSAESSTRRVEERSPPGMFAPPRRPPRRGALQADAEVGAGADDSHVARGASRSAIWRHRRALARPSRRETRRRRGSPRTAQRHARVLRAAHASGSWQTDPRHSRVESSSSAGSGCSPACARLARRSAGVQSIPPTRAMFSGASMVPIRRAACCSDAYRPLSTGGSSPSDLPPAPPRAHEECRSATVLELPSFRRTITCTGALAARGAPRDLISSTQRPRGRRSCRIAHLPARLDVQAPPDQEPARTASTRGLSLHTPFSCTRLLSSRSGRRSDLLDQSQWSSGSCRRSWGIRCRARWMVPSIFSSKSVLCMCVMPWLQPIPSLSRREPPSAFSAATSSASPRSADASTTSQSRKTSRMPSTAPGVEVGKRTTPSAESSTGCRTPSPPGTSLLGGRRVDLAAAAFQAQSQSVSCRK